VAASAPIRYTVGMSRALTALVIVAALLATGCGDGDGQKSAVAADDRSVTLDGTTLRLVCTAPSCFAGIVADDGVQVFVGRVLPTGVLADFEGMVLHGDEFVDVDIVTGDGDDLVELVDIGLPGALRIDTGNGDDRLDLCDAGARGDAEIATGRGDDLVQLDPGGYGAQLRIDTGVGDDEVRLGSGGYHGDVVVRTADGNDHVALSGPTFLSTARIDLGPGHDAIGGVYEGEVPVTLDGGPGRDVFAPLFHLPHPGLTVRNFEH
jgi:hypothetical protein